jgi:hypothetical protein
MAFAPDTEEAAGQEAAVDAAPEPSAPEEEAKGAWDGWTHEDIQRELGLDNEDMESLDSDPVFQSPQSPQSLDRVRDVLLQMSKPATYSDMILAVSRTLHMDAAFLDMQLGTEAGRTVLAQAGMADLHPGPMGIDLSGTSLGSGVALVSPEEAQKLIEGDG